MNFFECFSRNLSSLFPSSSIQHSSIPKLQGKRGRSCTIKQRMISQQLFSIQLSTHGWFGLFILKRQFIGTNMALLITATVECTMHMSTINLACQSKPQAQHISLDTHAELVCVVVQLTFHRLKVLKKHSQRICRKYFHIPEEKYTSREEIHKSLFEFQTTL